MVIPASLPSAIYETFAAVCYAHLSQSDVELYMSAVDASSFKSALSKNKKYEKDYRAEDARGFGEAIPHLPVDLLLAFLKMLGVAVVGELAKDATMALTYQALLLSVQKLSPDVRAKYEPWTSRVENYLRAKCNLK